MRFDGWNDELYHHGIKGQKWGIRRFQNPDGTLTEEGKARYKKFQDDQTRTLYERYGHNWVNNDRAFSDNDSPLSDAKLIKIIGKENYNRWNKIVSDSYDSNFHDYSGPYKKEWDKMLNKYGDTYYHQIDSNKLWEKVSGNWKDKLLRDILKTVPQNQKQYVYDQLRFNFYNYD